MTFSQLLEEVMSAIELDPNAGRVSRAEAGRLLNLAMHEISLRVGVPTIGLDVPTTGFVAGSFTLPVQVHPEGVKQAKLLEVNESVFPYERLVNRDIPILSMSEANRFHPGWDADEDIYGELPWAGRSRFGGPFIVYSPADAGTGIRPVGVASARYRLLVHALPPEMSEPQHEPFAVEYCAEGEEAVRYPGAMPAFHRVLAFHVAYELLQRLNNPSWQAYYARYQAMEQEMFNSINPVNTYLPSNVNVWRGPRYG